MAIKVANNQSLTAITALPTAAALTDGDFTLIKSQTADASSGTVAFVNGSSDVVLDSTYSIYLFKFINIHPNNDGDILRVNFSDDTSSHSYNLAKTTTAINIRHDEDGSDGEIAYSTGTDLAQGTGNKDLTVGVNNANEASCSGEMYLFSPSSTTFVKHFLAKTNTDYGGRCYTRYSAGYINTTAAVTAVQLTFTGGNIDAGTFKLYGVGPKQS